MAEFMRWDFYEPLLKAAKNYYHGMAHLEDKGGLVVNNLLGDALSLSGDIRSLVKFADDANAVLSNYLKRIREQTQLKNQIAALEANRLKYRDETNAFAQEFKALDKLSTDRDAVRSKYNRAKLNYQTVSEQLEALNTRVQNIPEYGIFITYGEGPIRIRFEDDVFGELSVAISGKINESARGTARDQRAWDEIWVGFLEAKEQNNTLLEPAFRIALGTEWIAPSANATPDAFVSKTVLYNAGLGLSENALLALLDLTEDQFELRYLEVLQEDQWQQVLGTYFWPFSGSELLLYAADKSNETHWIARRVGSIPFKGLEQHSTTIWERIDLNTDVFSQIYSQVDTFESITVQQLKTKFS